uniref:Uncharacterized protein n=1 Tax=Cucumis melo TaxID=3656 RepID=A0A9I9CTY8_CUCME
MAFRRGIVTTMLSSFDDEDWRTGFNGDDWRTVLTARISFQLVCFAMQMERFSGDIL